MNDSISIIIPVLNEADQLELALRKLQHYRDVGVELIVVDGGSDDNSVSVAKPHVDVLLTCDPGRARQMNAGANAARGDLLVFLHIDTQLLDDETSTLQMMTSCPHWGFFKVRLSSSEHIFRVIESLMNLRSTFTKIATGDQTLVVRRKIFEQCNGYAPISLMEDVELTKRLRRIVSPTVFESLVETSARRWEKHGAIKTIILMWRLRLAFWMGVNADSLARYYG